MSSSRLKSSVLLDAATDLRILIAVGSIMELKPNELSLAVTLVGYCTSGSIQLLNHLSRRDSAESRSQSPSGLCSILQMLIAVGPIIELKLNELSPAVFLVEYCILGLFRLTFKPSLPMRIRRKPQLKSLGVLCSVGMLYND